jgi:hypothetical protein
VARDSGATSGRIDTGIYTTVLVLYTGARVYGQHGAYYATGHLTRLCEGALRGPPPRAPSNLYME